MKAVIGQALLGLEWGCIGIIWDNGKGTRKLLYLGYVGTIGCRESWAFVERPGPRGRSVRLAEANNANSKE